MIDPPSDSDEFGDEVIYSQESPKVGDIITDYDWDSDRFIEFNLPFTRNEILSPGNNSSRWNKNNSSVMIDNHQRRNEIKKLKNQIIIKHQYRLSVGTEIVKYTHHRKK